MNPVGKTLPLILNLTDTLTELITHDTINLGKITLQQIRDSITITINIKPLIFVISTRVSEIVLIDAMARLAKNTTKSQNLKKTKRSDYWHNQWSH